MAVQDILGIMLVSFVMSLSAGKVIIWWFRRRNTGQFIRPEGPVSHREKAGTPTMGGIGIIVSVLLAVYLWRRSASPEALLICLSAAGFAVIGMADDLLKIYRRNSEGLSPGAKLILQGAAASLLMGFLYRYARLPLTEVYIPWFFQQPIDIGTVYYPLAVLYIICFVNSVNLTDGLDGLASGLGIIASSAALVIAAMGIAVIPGIREGVLQGIPGSGDIALVISALIGALAGFLIFNRKPARLFMGDTGSQALGGLLAVTAILLRSEVLFLVISGMFLIESFSVILQVGSWKIRHKRIFNMAPLHHHYELAGKSETAIVRAFWGMGALLAVAGIAGVLLG